MAVIIDGDNTPTAGGIVYGDGTAYASTAAGSAGQVLQSNGSGAPSWVAAPATSPAGSTGQVQYNNAGAFGAISSGTSGQVLTSAGAGVAPNWVTPAGGGAWVYLSSVTANNSSTVSLESTIDGTYDVYVIVGTAVVPTFDTALLFSRLKIGSTYQNSGYYFHSSRQQSDSSTYLGTAGGGASDITLFSQTGGTSLRNSNFYYYLYSPANTSIVHCVSYAGTTIDSDGTTRVLTGGAYLNVVGAINGVRFYYNTGNISSGTFRLYGIKNS